MQSIDRSELASVRGGFGALLGAALQAAPGILQGVSGIIGAAKSGGGGGAPQGGPPPQAAAAAAAGGAGMMAPPQRHGGGSDVSVTVGTGALPQNF